MVTDEFILLALGDAAKHPLLHLLLFFSLDSRIPLFKASALVVLKRGHSNAVFQLRMA